MIMIQMSPWIVEIISRNLIAPCGMNCGICMAHLREKNRCQGCQEAEKNKPKTRVFCKIRICQERKGKYCFNCPRFPCDRLKSLDKRYRTKYGMSEIENLEFIRCRGDFSKIKSYLEEIDPTEVLRTILEDSRSLLSQGIELDSISEKDLLDIMMIRSARRNSENSQ